jgi:ribosomal protein S18 acetylase RimI-like enzyme
VNILPTKQIDKNTINHFFQKHWGSNEMVISSGVYYCDSIDGFAALDETDKIIGLITYIIRNDECEIISLDSTVENKGIGSLLIKEVENLARTERCKKITLVTTNDNIHALGFYQRRGYRLVDIYVNAVEEARKIKPQIPLLAENGIQIMDELLLEKIINY